MNPQTYFDLFKLSYAQNDNYPTFKDVINAPKQTYIKISKNGNEIDLDGKITRDGELYTGVFCLVQTIGLPPKVKFGEEPEELLDDDDDAGLGHYTLFLYDSKVEIIAISRNRNGVSANGTLHFFARNYGLSNTELELVINPADLQRISKLTTVNTFEISIAKPQSAIPFLNEAKAAGINELIRLADETNANVLKLEIGIGYERDSTLKKASILDWARRLFRDQKATIKKLEIRGRESDESAVETIDLVTNKVQLIVNSKKVRSINRLYLNGILRAACTEYRKIENQMVNVYKVRKNKV